MVVNLNFIAKPYLLLQCRCIFLVFIIEWVYCVRVIIAPFLEVVGNVEASVVVGTVLKVDEDESWFA